MENVKHIHFIGIGGAGMGGIAEVLLRQGYTISGSDLNRNSVTERLKQLNATIIEGHDVQNITGADIVVVSTAVPSSNPELIAAQKARIPIIPRAQMLAELMRFKQGIAVAGTHGKTTTTSLVASVLAEGGFDPTFVIGGLLKSAGTHAYLGKSEFFVAEADESDASFLYLFPQIAIVTNIDEDHLSTYNNDFHKLRETFLEFLHRLPFNGLAVVCIDEPIVREILPAIARPTITYGFDSFADIQIIDFQQMGTQSHFKFRHKTDEADLDIILNLPGRHNAVNAAAAYAVSKKIGVAPSAIQKAFTKFAGVDRRFQIHGEFDTGQGKVMLIDDYGHHPREISVTLSAIRSAWPDRRLVVAYQPHRYSRTQALFNDFVKALTEQLDMLVLLDIYSAGEALIPEASGEVLFNAIQQHSKCKPVFVKQPDELPTILATILQDGDILLMQGAGSIGALANRLAAMEMRLV
jgi:UDP-N-acetylmuramate--alanine ligase